MINAISHSRELKKTTTSGRPSQFLLDEHRQRLRLRHLVFVYPQRHPVLAERLERLVILGHHEHAHVALELALTQNLAGQTGNSIRVSADVNEAVMNSVMVMSDGIITAETEGK